MKITEKYRAMIIAIVAMAVVACHSFTSPHDNFKNQMQTHIGMRVDDIGSYIARYPQYISGEVELPSGNKEIAYYAGYSGQECTVFFEVDKVTEMIISWRFVGTEETCIMVP